MRTLGIIFAIIGLIGLGGVLSGIGGIFLWMFLGGTIVSALAAIQKFMHKLYYETLPSIGYTQYYVLDCWSVGASHMRGGCA